MPDSACVYLDNSATTQVCIEAAQKVMDVMTFYYGNPSSKHSMGVEAENILNNARRSIASVLCCRSDEIYFTSGGTESNNLAVFGAAKALKRRGRRIVTTQIEHPSVLKAMDELEKDGFEVIRLKPDIFGRINEDDIYNAVTPETI